MDSSAIDLAIEEMRAHPAVVRVGAQTRTAAGGVVLEIDLDLQFPSRWAAAGKSPNGVLAVETMRVEFTRSYPVWAPELSLRPDFDRAHAHVQPWTTSDGRVVPCLVEGSLVEFVAVRGMYDLIEQAVMWLNSAANGALIDPAQGWEPMRRDNIDDHVALAFDEVRAHVARDGGHKFYRTGYMCRWSDRVAAGFSGQLRWTETAKDAAFSEERASKRSDWSVGVCTSLVVWAGKHPDGTPIVGDHYLPDDVVDVRGLLDRAATWGMKDQLETAARLLRGRGEPGKIYPLPVIFLVRRPYNLIGSVSNIEVCAYVAPYSVDTGMLVDGRDPVRPLGVRETITPELLERMSGEKAFAPWALLGCGSLGSKMGMHLGRRGLGPKVVCDKGTMGPHNAARHALYPNSDWVDTGWIGPKAYGLTRALRALGQEPEPIADHHRWLLKRTDTESDDPVSWLLNSTASTVVREDLARARSPSSPRGVEACLYDAGRLGLLSVEGLGRNPDGGELISAFYQFARSAPDVGDRLFRQGGELSRQSTGQGCGSLTMVMSDAALSMMAAAMSETFINLSLEEARGLLTVYRREGDGLAAQRVSIPPFRRVPLDDLETWSVSLSSEAERKIEAEVQRYRRVETGGILIGRASVIARRIYVVDVLAAPRDSRRSAHEFVLGVQGVTEELNRIGEATGGALGCVGTWHSHLGTNLPSTKDFRSAALVGSSAPSAMAFLIRGADGYRAISTHTPGGAAAITGEGGAV